MQIQKINNFSNQNKTINPQFKKTYKVIHWVGEQNANYAPVAGFELSKKLQSLLVRILNSAVKGGKNSANKVASEYVKTVDTDYATSGIVRSYYDKYGGFNKMSGKFLPFSYLITGGDAYKFSEKYGKPLGKAKAFAPVQNGRPNSAELQLARSDYNMGGWALVNDKNKKIYNSEGVEQELHTKFEVVRNKKGKITGYNLVGIKFCPVKGEENPFVRMGYTKPENL